MPDAVGYRAKWGVIIPSTNTVVEHDLALLTPHGITCHAGRAYIGRPSMGSDRAATDVLDQMDAAFEEALRDVLTVEPDHLVIAMSAEVIRRGTAGAEGMIRELEERTHLPVTTGPTACAAALRELGVETIALVTPYQPVSDEAARRYFTEQGFKVARVKGLRCPSATAIAHIGEAELIAALRDLDGPDVDALVQVGTNLSMVRLAAEAERWLGKPTIAMNAATVWHALRRDGFVDRLPGFGVLLREH